MKRYIAFFAAALALFACQPQQPDGSQYAPAPLLPISTGTAEFGAEGGTSYVSVDSREKIEAEADRDWVLVSADNYGVRIKASENNTIETRYSIVVIKSGGLAATVQVIQFGLNTKYFWDEEYAFGYNGGSVELAYKTDATVVVKVSGSEWIDAVPDNGIFTINVAKNPYKEIREGFIEWTAGDDVRNIVIRQALNPSGGSGGGDEPGGSVLFSEDFESEDNLDGWGFIDLDGDGYCWALSLELAAHSESGALISQSYINNVGALHPDNWAFTPAISFTNDSYLSFWVTAQDQSYANEHYAAYITESLPESEADLEAMTKLHEATYPAGNPAQEETLDEHVWQRFVVAIPAGFAGKTGYIAFRHFNCTDMFYLNLDDVMVTRGTPNTSSLYFPAPRVSATAAAFRKLK